MKNEQTFTVQQIGVIHSPFTDPQGIPIQSSSADGAVGEIEIFDTYVPALKDLEGFERIWLVYWFDRVKQFKPLVTPFLDTVERGLFSTRAPVRPNPIGISSVRLEKIEESTIWVGDIDVLDGTPLIDIKPYVSRFDSFPGQRCGWLDNAKSSARSDGRFLDGGST